MSNLSTLANMAEILGVIIVIGGLFFAVLQMRQIRQQRRELAAIELFRFFGNPRFTAAYQMVLHLPDGLSAEDIRTKLANLDASVRTPGLSTGKRDLPAAPSGIVTPRQTLTTGKILFFSPRSHGHSR